MVSILKEKDAPAGIGIHAPRWGGIHAPRWGLLLLCVEYAMICWDLLHFCPVKAMCSRYKIGRIENKTKEQKNEQRI